MSDGESLTGGDVGTLNFFTDSVQSLRSLVVGYFEIPAELVRRCCISRSPAHQNMRAAKQEAAIYHGRMADRVLNLHAGTPKPKAAQATKYVIIRAFTPLRLLIYTALSSPRNSHISRSVTRPATCQSRSLTPAAIAGLTHRVQ